MATKLKIGILGTCPVCEGEFKTKNRRMVHHGYRRPGHGSIVGDCFAVELGAYEVSPWGCKAYRTTMLGQIENLKNAIEMLPLLTEITEYVRNRLTLREEPKRYTPADREWPQILRSRKNRLEYDVKNCEQAVARMDRLIANWVEKPLREVTEATAEAVAKAEREARAAERQVKRDAKKAKTDARMAKEIARDEARMAHVRAFVEVLKGILRTASTAGCFPDTVELEAARALALELRSKKNVRRLGHFFVEEYITHEEREIFAQLGLGTKTMRAQKNEAGILVEEPVIFLNV